MARASSRILPALLMALALAAFFPSMFVPVPESMDRRAALGAAAVAAAMAGQHSPAEAAVAQFSFFGFGGGKSDAYNQLDDDAYSPYSQFANPGKSDYTNDQKLKDSILARNKGKVQDFLTSLDKVPNLIKTKQSENLKSLLTLKLYQLRASMEYISTGGAPFYRK